MTQNNFECWFTIKPANSVITSKHGHFFYLPYDPWIIILLLLIWFWYIGIYLFNFVGFYFIPGALSTEEQCYWIRESLRTFPQPPNRTNLTSIYGSISDLFIAAKNQKILVQVENPDVQEKNEQNNGGGKTQSKIFKFVEASDVQKREECRSTTKATALVRKLRWSTLGLQFDWSKVCVHLLPWWCY